MKKLILIFLLLLTTSTLPAAELPGWMTGTWRATTGEAISEEIWSAADGTLMTGTNRALAPGKKTWFEFLRIENRDGTLVYIAMPAGNPATEFAAVKVEPSRITFENLMHDFPQRIIYWRKAAQLCARVEATDGKGEEWCWSRVGR